MYCIGWPRTTVAITSATWTNGGTTVDDIVGPTLSREAHCGRWITAPDGKDYLITKITDSNTLIIDRKYPSSSQSGANGAATIKADEDYSIRPAAGQSAGWDSDAQTLPVIDFNDADYQLQMSGSLCWEYHNLRFEDSADSAGVVDVWGSYFARFLGCLFKQSTQNKPVVRSNTNGLIYLERFVVEGSGSGTSQQGLSPSALFGVFLRNGAIYNVGAYGIHPALGYLENVNIGVEEANGLGDIRTYSNMFGVCYDCNFSSFSMFDYRNPTTFRVCPTLMSENHGKILGAHKSFSQLYILEKLDVVAESGDPYKRPGGADSVIKVGFNTSSSYVPLVDKNWVLGAFLIHEFEVETGSKTYRYYVQSEASLAATGIWLEAEYVDVYDDSDEYHMARAVSDESVTVRSGADDWSQYLEVTVNPAVAGKVRIKGFVNYYHATNEVYVDPKVVIS
jgi:hypothetical protein